MRSGGTNSFRISSNLVRSPCRYGTFQKDSGAEKGLRSSNAGCFWDFEPYLLDSSPLLIRLA
jgi:hypothetical protein